MKQCSNSMSPLCPPLVRGELKGDGFVIAFILSVLCFLVSAIPVYAGSEKGSDPKYIFYTANSYYEAGRYDDAIREYSKLLDQGLESGSLYFNLGNSYFKKGELGRAVVNYERAMRLIPRDGDLKSNYKFAQSKIASDAAQEVSWINNQLNRFDSFTINEITVILCVLWASLFLLLTARILSVTVRRYAHGILAVPIIISLPFAFSLYNRVSALNKEVVVISESAETRFEPLDNATVHFTLFEGMKGYMHESKKGWIKISRQDGKAGWVRDETLEKI